MTGIRYPLLLAVLAATAAAQGGVLVVDAAGGPGSQFTDIPPAVAAARPGDRIVVRSGEYSGFAVMQGIAILGEPGARVVRADILRPVIEISNLPAGAECVIRQLEIDATSLGSPPLLVGGCCGRVVIEDVSSMMNTSLQVISCDQVLISRCTLAGAIFVLAGTATLDSCRATTPSSFQTEPALRAFQSNVLVSRCHLASGAAFLAEPAVSLDGSTLTVTGDGSGEIRTGAGMNAESAIVGINASSVVLDDDVRVIPSGSAPPVATQPGSLSTTVTNVPSLQTTGAPLGGLVTIDLFSEAGDSYVLLASTLGDPLPFPALSGEIWLDPTLIIAVQSGVLASTARFTATFGVPTNPALAGIPIAWQAVAGLMSDLRLSNPSGYAHGF